MGCIKLVMIAGVWIYNFHTKHNLQQPEDMTSWPVRILQDITMPLLENLYECVCRYTHPYITLPASFITKIQLLNTFILPSFTIIHLLYILLMLFVPANIPQCLACLDAHRKYFNVFFLVWRYTELYTTNAVGSCWYYWCCC